MFRNFQKLFETSPNLNGKLTKTKSCFTNSLFPISMNMSSYANIMKVAVVGGAGKIGQPLCLMLKQSPLIDELCVHDITSNCGFVCELNYVDTNCRVTSFTGKENLPSALKNSRIVVVLASTPEADLISSAKACTLNAEIIRDVAVQFGRNCPKAFLAIATNPINSMVPLACEILKKTGSFNPCTVFGITTLNTVRANTFVAKTQCIAPECVVVPVIGGNTEETIIPVLSQAKPNAEFTIEELENITTNIRKAQENIQKLKTPETGTFSGAFAISRFVISLVKAIRGCPDIVESAYVPSKVHPQLKYLATPLLLGLNGVMKNLGVPKLTEFESCMLDNAIPILMNDIKRGEHFAEHFQLCNEHPEECKPKHWCEGEEKQQLPF